MNLTISLTKPDFKNIYQWIKYYLKVVELTLPHLDRTEITYVVFSYADYLWQHFKIENPLETIIGDNDDDEWKNRADMLTAVNRMVSCIEYKTGHEVVDLLIKEFNSISGIRFKIWAHMLMEDGNLLRKYFNELDIRLFTKIEMSDHIGAGHDYKFT